MRFVRLSDVVVRLSRRCTTMASAIDRTGVNHSHFFYLNDLFFYLNDLFTVARKVSSHQSKKT